jgi:hypothetical protein
MSAMEFDILMELKKISQTLKEIADILKDLPKGGTENV